MGECVKTHGTAIRPSPHRHTSGIKLWILRLQLVQCGELIFQFDPAELPTQRGGEFLAAIRGSPIIYRKNSEAFSQQHLVEEHSSSTPGFLDRLAGWPAVDIHD